MSFMFLFLIFLGKNEFYMLIIRGSCVSLYLLFISSVCYCRVGKTSLMNQYALEPRSYIFVLCLN